MRVRPVRPWKSGLEELWVVYPGERRYRLAERVEVVPLADLVAQPADPSRRKK